MIGLGTIVNVLAILAGGIGGLTFGRFLNEENQETLAKTCGVCTLFLSISGAMAEMLKVEGDGLASGRSMLVIFCLALGALIGELLNIERWFERFGIWLREKSGNSGDKRFIDGFVTATLTVSIGAMAILGSIQDGISGDHTTLFMKAILDFIIITVMTSSLGKGCVFSAIPVGIFQGSFTAFARLIRPIMTAEALSNISLVGSILIFCVGVNLVWNKQIRVANLLPALVLAVLAAFLPIPL